LIVVSNTSPIIILFYAQHLDIFHKLFGTIYIPPAVYHELTIRSAKNQICSTLKNCHFIKVKSLEKTQLKIEHKLDLGEIEAITLAKQMNSDFLILDDKRAQKEAALQSIPFVSSFALLLKASQKGIIADINDTLDLLKEHHIFLSKDLKQFLDFLNKQL